MNILPDGRLGLVVYFGLLIAIGLVYVSTMPLLLSSLAIYGTPALLLFIGGGVTIGHLMHSIFEPFEEREQSPEPDQSG